MSKAPKHLFRLVFIPWDGLAFISDEAYYWHEALSVRQGYLNKSPHDKVFICIDGDPAIEYVDKVFEAIMMVSD